MATSRLEIDLSAVERNLDVVRSVVRGSTRDGIENGGARHAVGVCAVVKQDAYGLGAARIAKRLGACGVDMLAVYTPDEARAVAENVPQVPVLILMPARAIDRMDPLYRHAATGRIHVVVHDLDQLAAMTEMASRLGVSLPIHVQIDTGLARGGACPQDAKTIVEKAAAHGRLRLAGLMTHFSTPATDEALTREQARLFREFIAGVKPVIREAVAEGRAEGGLEVHAANSAATFRSSKLHGTMVRVGQSLYGFSIEDVDDPPTCGWEFTRQAQQLTPAVRWTSSIVHVQSIPAGWPVGYGSTWRAPRASRIALVPVGYADGYARSLGGGYGVGWVGLTGRAWERLGGAERDDMGDAVTAAGRTTGAEPGGVIYAPVVGRVSMDQITIDVTEVPERYLRVGAEVELYGRDRAGRNYLPALAAAGGTITHELLCRISPRVERVYRYPASAIGGALAENAQRATLVAGARSAPFENEGSAPRPLPPNIARLATPVRSAAGPV